MTFTVLLFIKGDPQVVDIITHTVKPNQTQSGMNVMTAQFLRYRINKLSTLKPTYSSTKSA